MGQQQQAGVAKRRGWWQVPGYRPRYDINSLENRDEGRIARVLEWLEPRLTRYFQTEIRHVGRVPTDRALLVGNHNGASLSPEGFLTGCALYRAGGTAHVPFALGHEVTLSLPVFHEVLVPLGAIRASHQNAQRAFDRGHKVLVYPGGDVEAMRPYRDRHRIVFGGRTGYVRLAVKAGVPIVPVVAAGAHGTLLILDDMRWLARLTGATTGLRTRVWPLALSFPWGLTLGPPPPFVPFPSRIILEFLPPMSFERRGEAAAQDAAYIRHCADRVEASMQATLTRLAFELATGRDAGACRAETPEAPERVRAGRPHQPEPARDARLLAS